MCLYQFNKLFSIPLCFSGADALDVLQFFDRYGIYRCHLLYRHILEYYVWRQPELLAHFLTQVLQHGAQHRVEGAAVLLACFFIAVFVKIVVFNNHERARILHKLIAFRCKFKQSIVLHILAYISGNYRLTHHGIPQTLVHVLSVSELFKPVVLVCHDIVRGDTFHKVYHIIRTEVFFQHLYRRQHDEQFVPGFNLCLGMETVVTVAAVFLIILLTEIMKQHFAAAHR